MREAAEAGNDVPVVAGVRRLFSGKILEGREAFRIELFRHANREFLRREIFGMLQRHVVEGPLQQTDFAVHAPVDGVQRQGERPVVAGERSGAPPVDIARELVEHDDQCEA